MKQKISTVVGTLIIIIMALTAGAFVFKVDKFDMENLYQPVKNQIKSKKTDKTVCTMEAKLCSDGTYVSRSGPNCEFEACPKGESVRDKIGISYPSAGQKISSPVSVSGQARGSWFFEGSFPVEVYDSNDKLLGSAPINFVQKTPTDTWMTENFVDFRGDIKFSKPSTDSGYILFKKDNPSDNPAMDESLRLDVNFEKPIDTSNWQTYRNDKYGFEFKYPKDIKMSEVNVGEDYILYLELSPLVSTETGYVVTIRNSKSKSIEDYFNLWKKDFIKPKNYEGLPVSPEVIEEKNIIINGENVKYLSTSGFPFAPENFYMLIHDSLLYEVSYMGEFTNGVSMKLGEKELKLLSEKHREILVKIISTFKFIN